MNTTPTIFISYSHKDETWKDRLVTHLGVSQQQGLLELWDDRRIEAGEDWYQAIVDAIDAGSIAILLVSKNSLTSKFILSQEVPRLLKRRDEEGLRIFPIVIEPCDWEAVTWLKQMQLRPKDGKPLSGGRRHQVETKLAAIAKEIRLLLSPPDATNDVVDSPAPRTVSRAPQKINISRLPVTGSQLFGREEQLKQLDEACANNETHIVSLVAWGGVGKSALVNYWLARLARDDYRGAERVYAWSFYSQGTTDRAVSADQFIEAALTWFGDPDPNEGTPWDKGERLAQLIAHYRTLLILDGLEPLQNPPGADEGKLKDQALQSLLRSLAAHNRGLCVISTRVAVADLAPFETTTAPRIDLDTLSPQAGAQVLTAQGVTGKPDELEKASAEFGGHSLALTLLGSYLADVYGGNITRRTEVGDLEGDVRYGGHAQRVMASYEKWFGEGAELSVLRILGLFNRPADRGAIDALRAAPAIPGLTDALQGLSEAQWQQVLSKLRRAKLLAAPSTNQPDTLDTHPLVREHFGRQLKLHHPDAWREGNSRLFDYFRLKVKSRPDSAEEMTFLYTAVIHGCQASRHQRAFEVYYARIQRGQEFYSPNKFGTVRDDLAVLSYFFDPDWQHPVASIQGRWRALLQGQAGYRLWLVGRLAEAIAPMQAALEADVARAKKAEADEVQADKAQEAWRYASVDAETLSAIYLGRGDLSRAARYSNQGVEFAFKSLDDNQKVSVLNSLGDVLHHQGLLSEAEDIFRKAKEIKEGINATEEHMHLFHHALGHRYHELLLSMGRYDVVQRNVERIIESHDRKSFHLIDIVLNHLLLGRAHLVQASHGDKRHLGSAEAHLNRAMENLERTEREIHVPRCLLALAELYRVMPNFKRARANLEEAMTLATRDGLELYVADCHLEFARLHLAQLEGAKARESWGKAKGMIERMGYHRRDRDVREIEEQLKAAGG